MIVATAGSVIEFPTNWYRSFISGEKRPADKVGFYRLAVFIAHIVGAVLFMMYAFENQTYHWIGDIFAFLWIHIIAVVCYELAYHFYAIMFKQFAKIIKLNFNIGHTKLTFDELKDWVLKHTFKNDVSKFYETLDRIGKNRDSLLTLKHLTDTKSPLIHYLTNYREYDYESRNAANLIKFYIKEHSNKK